MLGLSFAGCCALHPKVAAFLESSLFLAPVGHGNTCRLVERSRHTHTHTQNSCSKDSSRLHASTFNVCARPAYPDKWC